MKKYRIKYVEMYVKEVIAAKVKDDDIVYIPVMGKLKKQGKVYEEKDAKEYLEHLNNSYMKIKSDITFELEEVNE